MTLASASLAALLARPAVARVFAALDGGGEETRIVGGAVRNALLGLAVHEVDFATTALPGTTMARAEAAGFRVVPTGLEHGTVTLVRDGAGFEVTTLREDVETFGRRARVRFGRSFEQDALRRDFTINALFLSASGSIEDIVGGQADLDAGRVRFIGDPGARIREDALRILRFFRFHADYARGGLDPAGFDAAIALRDRLAILSRERVRAELLKLLCARRAVETLGDVAGAGFLTLLLGGVVELGRFARVAAVDSEGPDPVRRLAALAVQVEEDAVRLQGRLRLSGQESSRLGAYAAALARLRSPDPPLGVGEVRALAAICGREALGDVLAATAGEPRPIITPEARTLLARYLEGREALPQFPLRGADLIACGFPPGPGLGAALEVARTAWLEQGCPEGEGRLEELIAIALATQARTKGR